ncbi:MAG TPA: hypothetical protein VGV89_03895 [Thermoplasmata archaeon]|nr:hypothetical protein [Thermoplasmata archaeon]
MVLLVVAVAVIAAVAVYEVLELRNLSKPSRGGGGENSTSPSGTILVANGTTWPIGPRHYEGSWFNIDYTSEVQGTFRSSTLVTGYILPSGAFVGYAGANSSYGAVPASGSPSPNNWTSGSSMGGYIDTFLDPGEYEIFFVNANSSATASLGMTSDLIASTESVG